MNKKADVLIFKMNKRGDVAIVILVLLALLVTSAALFSFATSSGKVNAKISDTGFIEKLNIQKNLIEFYIVQAGENAIVGTYEELGGKTNEVIKEEFAIRFRENFKEEFRAYDFGESYLINLKSKIEENDFQVLKEKEILTIDVFNLELEESAKSIEIYYKPKISVGFELTKYKN